MSPTAVTFATVVAVLFAAHQFGGHWYGQTPPAVLGKADPQ
jgi:hypothetical protein